MTKEDCLNKSILDHHDSWVLNDSVDFFDGYASSVLKAMDEYAKQECIELINFLQWDERLIEDEGDANKLYELYIQSKENKDEK